MIPSLVDHPGWNWIKPFIRIEEYRREGGTKNPRFRIELKPMDLKERAVALVLKVGCASCGKAIHPLRARRPSKRSQSGHLYYAACCPLEVNIGCSRSSAAKDEYKRIRSAVRAA